MFYLNLKFDPKDSLSLFKIQNKENPLLNLKFFRILGVEIFPEFPEYRISLKNGFKAIERTCYFLNILRNYLLS
ncbi:hypothetical protein LEP1GSC124_2700 [Leptospira interrogans serovar Pyrogenes str. 200701872]|uniref:Uncharacterized protein n=1 Tax=Leptospira interrogans serovar Pyrogenes str. 200701872 TaxID=1193029 RepID=M6ZWV7_LEPIR|nr:hypothetical protein LEP1GSC124_2700 [Leptospira interrogans serovar Pyrogenes str. 200701872]